MNLNLYIILITAISVFCSLILRWLKKRYLKAHLTAITIVIAEKLLEKYEPGQHLYRRQIDEIKKAICYACEFRKIDLKDFDQMINSLESNNSLNYEEVERLGLLFDLQNTVGEQV